VRRLDRFFDNDVMTPQGKFVLDALRPSRAATATAWRKRADDIEARGGES
jgi:hypothetical protein